MSDIVTILELISYIVLIFIIAILLSNTTIEVIKLRREVKDVKVQLYNQSIELNQLRSEIKAINESAYNSNKVI